MAELVYKDPYLMIGTDDLSEYVRQVTISYAAEIKDTTAGPTTARTKIAGLTDWSVSIELNQDYDAGAVDDVLFDLVGAEEFDVKINPKGGVTGADNPQFSGKGLLADYQPLAGSIGEVITAPITIEGSGVLARARS